MSLNEWIGLRRSSESPGEQAAMRVATKSPAIARPYELRGMCVSFRRVHARRPQ